MTVAVLSIGSNIGDRLAHLRSVVSACAEGSGNAGGILARSQLYLTPPWGGVDQEDFLNAILIIEDPRPPREILRAGQALEAAADRVRLQRWGPRTLDVDIVAAYRDRDAWRAHGELTSTDAELTLPHPQAQHRAFVLLPWLDADPGAWLSGRPVGEYAAELPPEECAGVRPAPMSWGDGWTGTDGDGGSGRDQGRSGQ